MTDPVLPRPVRVAGIIFAALLGVALIIALAATVWIAARGASAYGHLRAAESTVRDAVDSLSDPAQASALIAELSAETSSARELTSDPVWRAAEALPWVGPQLTAVSTVAAAADDVAGSALAPLADVASSFSVDAFRPVDGRIDTTVFQTIAEPARVGADGVADAAASVASLQDQPLLGPVRDAIDEVATLLDTSATATDALARATELLPAMLGAAGERDYLIVFQNNAEWRSLGGIIGAMAVIHTADGGMAMTAQGSSSDFPRYDESVLPLDPEVEAIYGQRPGQWVQNVTQTPDFTVGGALAREMWLRETGTEVDGVIAIDPIALSYILEATGPVALDTGDTLTAENAVDLLLNEVYLRYERPRDQDAFFAAAAARVFEALSTGAADPTSLVAALGRAGEERRLLLWSAIPEDQVVLEGTTLAGGLPETDRETARFGVFLNDGTGSKMDYYVTAATTVDWGSCAVDSRGLATGEITLSVTLANTAPPDAATSLPFYITAGGAFGVPPGIARTVGYVYLPRGYGLQEATISTEEGFGGGFHDDRQVLSFSVDLDPGASSTTTIRVSAPEPSAPSAEAIITPTIRADEATTIRTACGAG